MQYHKLNCFFYALLIPGSSASRIFYRVHGSVIAVSKAQLTLPDRIKEQQEKMKEQMFDQLKQLGNMVLKPFGLSTENFKVQKNPDSEGYSINFVR
ncbi:unnamed protein product [Echinostoma caproni]|uniref:Uncharacterized protein n=1 Tax=Echinostoma caproni TaxID=27848 RepID=A0A3P8GX67_9TREM|nr:unnamed protein product [Echinostoma caproni]